MTGRLVFSDRSLAACPPARGLPAVTRIRRALEQVSVESAESDPIAAAVRIRGMLKHRSLIVLLTDLDDAGWLTYIAFETLDEALKEADAALAAPKAVA